MKSRANLKARNSGDTIVAFDSIQSLTFGECLLAFEAFQAMRHGRGIEHQDFITILALRMRIAQFEQGLAT